MISDTPSVTEAIVPASTQPARLYARLPLWEWLALAAMLALAALLDFSGIDHNGFGNTYYATAVRSMSLTWHNWFFASFDPGGFVSVDKPPLGFWVQVASVKVFGFHGPALILPQAIAGVISVGVLYCILRQAFGGRAALLGALALAISPINVVSNRDNTFESLVVLVLLVAAFALTKALEHGSLRWLLVSAVFIGFGFNIKMLEAYLVVPAFAITYMLAAPVSWRARILHLLAAGGLMLLVSGAWIIAVDLTPAASRPYVGSSYHNSELDLVFAYNGVQRLIGTPWTHMPSSTMPIGAPGPFRLLTSNLASQIAWWLPLTFPPLIVLLRPTRRSSGQDGHQRRVTLQQGILLLWGIWLLTMIIFFSQAVFMNLYYVALLAPAIAALVGISLTTLWTALQAGRWQGWLLLASIVGTVVEQGIILSHYQTWNSWLLPVVGGLAVCLVSIWAVVVPLQRLPARVTRSVSSMAAVILAITVGLAPVLWTCSSLHPDTESGFPAAGPSAGGKTVAAPPSADPLLIAYLRQHQAGATFLVATVDTDTAVPLIFSTGAPVMALGGYTGYDPILTPTTLAEAVARNAVRFFYVPSSNLTPQQRQQLYPHVTGAVTQYTNHLTRWAAEHCRAVPPDQWSAAHGGAATQLNTMQLFDCSTLVTLGTSEKQDKRAIRLDFLKPVPV